MASAEDVCTNYPEFAVICSFIENFREKLNFKLPNIEELQILLEDNENVNVHLSRTIALLLRRIFNKSVPFEKWQEGLQKFISHQDAHDVEKIGFKKLKLGTKIRVLKNLLEAQFDRYKNFKDKVNTSNAHELRLKPCGRDKNGIAYWCHLDESANLRVYKDDQEEETWKLVARSREELVSLIEQLKNDFEKESKDIPEDSETNFSDMGLSQAPTPLSSKNSSPKPKDKELDNTIKELQQKTCDKVTTKPSLNEAEVGERLNKIASNQISDKDLEKDGAKDISRKAKAKDSSKKPEVEDSSQMPDSKNSFKKTEAKEITTKSDVNDSSKKIERKDISKKVEIKDFSEKSGVKSSPKKTPVKDNVTTEAGISKKTEVKDTSKETEIKDTSKKAKIQDSFKKTEIRGSQNVNKDKSKKTEVEDSPKKTEITSSQKKMKEKETFKKTELKDSPKEIESKDCLKKAEIGSNLRKTELSDNFQRTVVKESSKKMEVIDSLKKTEKDCLKKTEKDRVDKVDVKDTNKKIVVQDNVKVSEIKNINRRTEAKDSNKKIKNKNTAKQQKLNTETTNIKVEVVDYLKKVSKEDIYKKLDPVKDKNKKSEINGKNLKLKDTNNETKIEVLNRNCEIKDTNKKPEILENLLKSKDVDINKMADKSEVKNMLKKVEEPKLLKNDLKVPDVSTKSGELSEKVEEKILKSECDVREDNEIKKKGEEKIIDSKKISKVSKKEEETLHQKFSVATSISSTSNFAKKQLPPSNLENKVLPLKLEKNLASKNEVKSPQIVSPVLDKPSSKVNTAEFKKKSSYLDALSKNLAAKGSSKLISPPKEDNNSTTQKLAPLSKILSLVSEGVSLKEKSELQDKTPKEPDKDNQGQKGCAQKDIEKAMLEQHKERKSLSAKLNVEPPAVKKVELELKMADREIISDSGKISSQKVKLALESEKHAAVTTNNSKNLSISSLKPSEALKQKVSVQKIPILTQTKTDFSVKSLTSPEKPKMLSHSVNVIKDISPINPSQPKNVEMNKSVSSIRLWSPHTDIKANSEVQKAVEIDKEKSLNNDSIKLEEKLVEKTSAAKIDKLKMIETKTMNVQSESLLKKVTSLVDEKLSQKHSVETILKPTDCKTEPILSTLTKEQELTSLKQSKESPIAFSAIGKNFPEKVASSFLDKLSSNKISQNVTNQNTIIECKDSNSQKGKCSPNKPTVKQSSFSVKNLSTSSSTKETSVIKLTTEQKIDSKIKRSTEIEKSNLPIQTKTDEPKKLCKDGTDPKNEPQKTAATVSKVTEPQKSVMSTGPKIELKRPFVGTAPKVQQNSLVETSHKIEPKKPAVTETKQLDSKPSVIGESPKLDLPIRTASPKPLNTSPKKSALFGQSSIKKTELMAEKQIEKLVDDNLKDGQTKPGISQKADEKVDPEKMVSIATDVISVAQSKAETGCFSKQQNTSKNILKRDEGALESERNSQSSPIDRKKIPLIKKRHFQSVGSNINSTNVVASSAFSSHLKQEEIVNSERDSGTCEAEKRNMGDLHSDSSNVHSSTAPSLSKESKKSVSKKEEEIGSIISKPAVEKDQNLEDSILKSELHVTKSGSDLETKNKYEKAAEVGEAITEAVMIIKGEGEGKLCDSGNDLEIDRDQESDDAICESIYFQKENHKGNKNIFGVPINKDVLHESIPWWEDFSLSCSIMNEESAICEDVIYFTGDGMGADCEAGNSGDEETTKINAPTRLRSLKKARKSENELNGIKNDIKNVKNVNKEEEVTEKSGKVLKINSDSKTESIEKIKEKVNDTKVNKQIKDQPKSQKKEKNVECDKESETANEKSSHEKEKNVECDKVKATNKSNEKSPLEKKNSEECDKEVETAKKSTEKSPVEKEKNVECDEEMETGNKSNKKNLIEKENNKVAETANNPNKKSSLEKENNVDCNKEMKAANKLSEKILIEKKKNLNGEKEISNEVEFESKSPDKEDKRDKNKIPITKKEKLKDEKDSQECNEKNSELEDEEVESETNDIPETHEESKGRGRQKKRQIKIKEKEKNDQVDSSPDNKKRKKALVDEKVEVEPKNKKRKKALIEEKVEVEPEPELPRMRTRSARIAKLREKEEGARIDAEADRMEQLKRRETRKKARIARNYLRELKKSKKEKKEAKKVRGRGAGKTSTSESSSDDFEEDLHPDDELVFKSDHEFSAESGIDDDTEPTLVKRARTAFKDTDSGSGSELEDVCCKVCSHQDHPETILLCDNRCDDGYHLSCLRPPLLSVPEGNWFCPKCEHKMLIDQLNFILLRYDDLKEKSQTEEGISQSRSFMNQPIDFLLPKKEKPKTKHYSDDSKSESGSSSDSESGSASDSGGSDSSEPLYTLRARSSKSLKEQVEDYDAIINEAIREEMELAEASKVVPEAVNNKVVSVGRGKDIANIMEGEMEEDMMEGEGEEEEEDDMEETGEKETEKAEIKDIEKKKPVEETEESKIKLEEKTTEDEEIKPESNEKDKKEADKKEMETDLQKPKKEKETNSDKSSEDESDKSEAETKTSSGKRGRVAQMVLKIKPPKKKRRLCDLDCVDEDEDSDEEFKAELSDEDLSEDVNSDVSFSMESESEESDYGKRKGRYGFGPLRRSTRNARSKQYDSDEGRGKKKKKKKRKRIISSEEDEDSNYSSDSEVSFKKKKKKPVARRVSTSKKRRGKSKGRKKAPPAKKKKSTDEKPKPRVKYAKPVVKESEQAEEDEPPKRRVTRGKKTVYFDSIPDSESDVSLVAEEENKSRGKVLKGETSESEYQESDDEMKKRRGISGGRGKGKVMGSEEEDSDEAEEPEADKTDDDSKSPEKLDPVSKGKPAAALIPPPAIAKTIIKTPESKGEKTAVNTLDASSAKSVNTTSAKSLNLSQGVQVKSPTSLNQNLNKTSESAATGTPKPGPVPRFSARAGVTMRPATLRSPTSTVLRGTGPRLASARVKFNPVRPIRPGQLSANSMASRSALSGVNPRLRTTVPAMSAVSPIKNSESQKTVASVIKTTTTAPHTAASTQAALTQPSAVLNTREDVLKAKPPAPIVHPTTVQTNVSSTATPTTQGKVSAPITSSNTNPPIISSQSGVVSHIAAMTSQTSMLNMQATAMNMQNAAGVRPPGAPSSPLRNSPGPQPGGKWSPHLSQAANIVSGASPINSNPISYRPPQTTAPSNYSFPPRPFVPFHPSNAQPGLVGGAPSHPIPPHQLYGPMMNQSGFPQGIPHPALRGPHPDLYRHSSPHNPMLKQNYPGIESMQSFPGSPVPADVANVKINSPDQQSKEVSEGSEFSSGLVSYFSSQRDEIGD